MLLKRRISLWRKDVKYAAKGRFQEITLATLTGEQDGDGFQICKVLKQFWKELSAGSGSVPSA